MNETDTNVVLLTKLTLLPEPFIAGYGVDSCRYLSFYLCMENYCQADYNYCLIYLIDDKLCSTKGQSLDLQIVTTIRLGVTCVRIDDLEDLYE